MFEKKRRKTDAHADVSEEVKTSPESPAALEHEAESEKAAAPALGVKAPEQLSADEATARGGGPLGPIDVAKEVGAEEPEKKVRVKMKNLFIINGVTLNPGAVVDVPFDMLQSGSFALHCEVLK